MPKGEKSHSNAYYAKKVTKPSKRGEMDNDDLTPRGNLPTPMRRAVKKARGR